MQISRTAYLAVLLTSRASRSCCFNSSFDISVLDSVRLIGDTRIWDTKTVTKENMRIYFNRKAGNMQRWFSYFFFLLELISRSKKYINPKLKHCSTVKEAKWEKKSKIRSTSRLKFPVSNKNKLVISTPKII